MLDERANNNFRKNGKEHNSVIDLMLFPLKTLKNLVPSILHIHLGIVLDLYEELEQSCKYLDTETASNNFEERSDLEYQTESVNVKINEISKNMLLCSGDIVDLSNYQARLDQIVKDPSKKSLDEMVKQLYNNSKKMKIIQCNSPVCLISEFDRNRGMVSM